MAQQVGLAHEQRRIVRAKAGHALQPGTNRRSAVSQEHSFLDEADDTSQHLNALPFCLAHDGEESLYRELLRLRAIARNRWTEATSRFGEE